MPRLANKALTAKAAEKARPPRSGYVEIPDGLVRGLCLRVSHTGVKSFILSTRVNGRLTRRSLGTFPGLGLADARQAAAHLKEDPRQFAEMSRRQPTPEPSERSFGQLADAYVKRGMVNHETGQPLKGLCGIEIRELADRVRRDGVENALPGTLVLQRENFGDA